MSNTNKKFTPRPYFNIAAEKEIEEMNNAQNPEQDQDSPSAEGTTPGNSSNKATSGEEATFEKRYKDLKKHYDAEVTRYRSELGTLEEKLNSSTKTFTPPKTVEELEEFRKQNPEFYEVMLSVAYEQANTVAGSTDTNKRISELEAKLTQTEQEKAFALIQQNHPDYVDIVSSQAFADWLDKQTSTVQSMVKGNATDADAFIRALDLYKLDNGGARKRGRPRKNAAETSVDMSAAQEVTATGSSSINVGEDGKRIWSREEIKRMSPQEFEKNEEELMAAMTEGRVR